jgi:hypothetical protein
MGAAPADYAIVKLLLVAALAAVFARRLRRPERCAKSSSVKRRVRQAGPWLATAHAAADRKGDHVRVAGPLGSATQRVYYTILTDDGYVGEDCAKTVGFAGS